MRLPTPTGRGARGWGRRCFSAALALGLSASLGCGGDAGSGELGAGPALTILTEGDGEPLSAPIWPLVEGARFDGTLIEEADGTFYYSTSGHSLVGPAVSLHAGSDGGIEVVATPRTGPFPRTDTLFPDGLRAPVDTLPSWRSDPFQGAAEQRIEIGKNAEGISSWHLARTTSAQFHANARTDFGYDRLWSFEHSIGNPYPFQRGGSLGPGYWHMTAGVGPAYFSEYVVPKAPVRRAEPPATTLRPLGPLLGESGVWVNEGIRVLQPGDGSAVVALRPIGAQFFTFVVEGFGGGAGFTAVSAQVCLTMRDGALESTAECVDPLFFAVHEGQTVELPYDAYTEHREANGEAGISAGTSEVRSYTGAPYVSDGQLYAVGSRGTSRWTGEAWEDAPWAKVRNVGPLVPWGCKIDLSPGDGFNRCAARPLVARPESDGAVSAFSFDGRVAGITVDAAHTTAVRRLGQMGRLSAVVSEGRREFYDVTPDGRVYRMLPDREGLRAEPVARFDVPKGHSAQGAADIAPGKLLIVTQREAPREWVASYNYDPFYDNSPADEVWRVDGSIRPAYGAPYFWLADIPEPRPAAALVPATHAVEVRAVGRHLEICTPPDYGPIPTGGWTLDNRTPEILESDDGCVLLTHQQGAMRVSNLPGGYWARGMLPGIGEVEVAAASHFALEDLWSCMNGGAGHGIDPAETLPEAAAPYTRVGGASPRLSTNGELYFTNATPWFDPMIGHDEPVLALARGCRNADLRPQMGPAFAWSHDAQRALPVPETADEYDLDAALRPAGVEVGGVLYQTAAFRTYGAVKGEVDDARFIAPPPTGGRHEVLLGDGLLCGRAGSEIYCQGLDAQPMMPRVPAPENPSAGQWWPLPRGVDPPGKYCHTQASGCPFGVAWLLGATLAQPWFTWVDPGPKASGLTYETVALADLFDGFPAAPLELQVSPTYLAPLVTRRDQDPTRLFVLVGARDAAGTRFWLARMEGTTATQIGGPYTLQTAELGRWGEVVEALPMPRLRMRPVEDAIYDANWPALQSLRVVSEILGDVTDQLRPAAGDL
ncbi:MAG: hypothetical protein R3F39_03865 [Myxococcota bacterium]